MMGQKKFSGPPSPPRVDPKTPKNGQNRVFGDFLQNFFDDLASFCQKVKLIETLQMAGQKNFSGPPAPPWVDPKTPKIGQNRVFLGFSSEFLYRFVFFFLRSYICFDDLLQLAS